MDLRIKSDTNMYQFLTWDIFLAWVPYIISLCISYTFNKKVTKMSLIWMVPLSASWLFFLPNSAYLFTEILHSFRYFNTQGETQFWINIDFWYNLTLTFAVAVLGLLLSTCSIIQIHEVLNKLVSKYSNMLVVGILLLLSSLGVYIGRFNRWNSWDVLSKPGQIVLDIVNDFTAGNSIVIEFVAIVFAIQLFAYVVVFLLTARSRIVD
ncbi:hypothetical protein PAECIP112173_03918 [Paenibacillus sp. JJ-100]|uniref:DUF1361 domain-containing protein n=1 Tax=Paenibacillus sp. JJ-100 TaxID=2974896 RepID=UPI0022FFBB73|nr:hypothetical protein PAECIP112173_03918 [Paenibacillus sp. JJ-100]